MLVYLSRNDSGPVTTTTTTIEAILKSWGGRGDRHDAAPPRPNHLCYAREL